MKQFRDSDAIFKFMLNQTKAEAKRLVSLLRQPTR